jgi:hypothetical protein
MSSQILKAELRALNYIDISENAMDESPPGLELRDSESISATIIRERPPSEVVSDAYFVVAVSPITATTLSKDNVGKPELYKYSGSYFLQRQLLLQRYRHL